ncbi:MAG: hypothetical protein G3I09_02695 [Ferrovum sp.]|nr:hypothetical protein [Ferrovum sp.]
MIVQTPVLFGLLPVLSWSVWTDLRNRKVSNLWILVGLLLYLLLLPFDQHGVVRAVIGGVVGLVIFLPFYWKGGMGAADLKLLGLVGVYLGPLGVVYCALYTALAGGGIAVWVLLVRGSSRLPYALAIASGVAVYLLKQGMKGGVGAALG